MESVTYTSGSENITLTSRELKDLIDDTYSPYGGLEDNYFFTLKFETESSGKAIFVFSELGGDYSDVVADNFTIEQKSNGRISVVFTNGSALSGTKNKNILTLAGNGVTYQFKKV